jgi:hypothetical protein
MIPSITLSISEHISLVDPRYGLICLWTFISHLFLGGGEVQPHHEHVPVHAGCKSLLYKSYVPAESNKEVAGVAGNRYPPVELTGRFGRRGIAPGTHA